MATGYSSSIHTRDLEVISDSEDRAILKWTRDSYFYELGEALDQLYVKRLLDNGKCTVCGNKTKKFCINCYTHYCSIDCQNSDWPKHKAMCKDTKLSTQFDIYESFHCIGNPINSKGSESKDPWVSKGRIVNGKEECMGDERFARIDVKYCKGEKGGSCKEMKNELLSKPEAALEDNGKDSNSKKENITDMGNELIINGKCGIRCERINKEERSDGTEVEERIGNGGMHESKETNVNTCELSLKEQEEETEIIYHDNSFSIGDIVEVVLMKISKDINGHYWVFQEKNYQALEAITKSLSKNSAVSSKMVDSEEVVQMTYNAEPVRVRLIRFEPKLLVHCVDTGVRFVPRISRCKSLPNYIQSVKGLAFQINVGDANLPESDVPIKLTIQILDVLQNESFTVKVLKINNKSCPRSGIDGTSESKREIMPEYYGNKNLRGSVLDELEIGEYGIFTSYHIHNEEIFGCLIPESADYCKKKIMSLYCMEADKIEAEVGDLVMVPNKENLGQRGLVKSKSENYGFEVRLIDYGYTVKTFKVYKVPEKARDITELGCKFVPKNFSDVEKTDSSSIMAFAEGYIGGTEDVSSPQMEYIPFESGCNVLISAIEEDSPENALYVRRVDLDWEKNLETLVAEINHFTKSSCTNFFDSVAVGDLVAATYSKDNIFYRAKVITKLTDVACVFFIDYGNKEIKESTDLRPLPSFLKEKPVFARRVTLANSGSSLINGNLGYLQKLVDDNQELIMTYEDISNGVTLTIEGGVNVNHKVFAQEKESTTEENSGPESSDAFSKKFLEHICFKEGPAKGFVILNLEDKEFMENGLFWASDLFSDDFNDIVLSSDITDHCESDKEEYVPSVGELCFALYEDGWYRGLVLEETGSNFKIFFVDFGNSCFATPESIRKMVPELFKTPPAAVRCYLQGFHEIPKEKIKSVCSSLKDKINETLSDVTIEGINENSCYVCIPKIF